jgi:hypothetical protein
LGKGEEAGRGGGGGGGGEGATAGGAATTVAPPTMTRRMLDENGWALAAAAVEERKEGQRSEALQQAQLKMKRLVDREGGEGSGAAGGCVSFLLYHSFIHSFSFLYLPLTPPHPFFAPAFEKTDAGAAAGVDSQQVPLSEALAELWRLDKTRPSQLDSPGVRGAEGGSEKILPSSGATFEGWLADLSSFSS